MPASVHAIVIARSGDAARVQLARALEALTAQSHPPVAITVVVTGPVAAVRGDGFPALVEGVIEARQSTTFAEGIELARPRVPDGRAVWLLPQDAVPEPDALAQLAGALERSPSAAVAAPKASAMGRMANKPGLGTMPRRRSWPAQAPPFPGGRARGLIVGGGIAVCISGWRYRRCRRLASPRP